MMTVMSASNMPAGKIETDPALMRRLLAGQFPHWAGLPIVPVVSEGTDHDIYRLGDHLAALAPKSVGYWSGDEGGAVAT
jgi:aminoglycoside phosphotransferase (APT) family kinase protein